LPTNPDHSTVLEEASAAPTRPPINAYVEEDGIPRYQTMMFQTTAPSSAASTTISPCTP
jgi:hypothetical protein